MHPSSSYTAVAETRLLPSPAVGAARANEPLAAGSFSGGTRGGTNLIGVMPSAPRERRKLKDGPEKVPAARGPRVQGTGPLL